MGYCKHWVAFVPRFVEIQPFIRRFSPLLNSPRGSRCWSARVLTGAKSKVFVNATLYTLPSKRWAPRNFWTLEKIPKSKKKKRRAPRICLFQPEKIKQGGGRAIYISCSCHARQEHPSTELCGQLCWPSKCVCLFARACWVKINFLPSFHLNAQVIRKSSSDVFVHLMGNAPHPVRSAKLSPIQLNQYLRGGPAWNVQ